MLIAAFVVAGLLIGSFLNVVIARVPERRSLWSPGSACPGCGAAIAWYDNIPILSFLALRARCRACSAPILWRYPIVEAITAGLFATAALRFGATVEAGVAAALLAVLVALTAIDLERQILPDVITLPGILAGVLANLATGRVPWLESLMGIIVGGGVFFVIILASGGGMGAGDMKLGAMLGAFLGWKIVLLSILGAVVVGGIVAVASWRPASEAGKIPYPLVLSLQPGACPACSGAKGCCNGTSSGFGGCVAAPRGFTMAEMVVVIAILAILAAVSVPSLWAYVRTAALRARSRGARGRPQRCPAAGHPLNTTVCVTNDGARARYHVGTCGGAAWTGVGTDADGTIRLANGVSVSGSGNLCFNYLGAGSATPTPCAANGTLTVANPAGGGTMSVIMATTGRVRIQ